MEGGTKHDPTRSAPDYRNRDNNRIYEMNSPAAPGVAVSLEIDFSHPIGPTGLAKRREPETVHVAQTAEFARLC
jgi:hypothetical protein